MNLGDKYAFPREEYQASTGRGQPGMTLRQHYAGLAMQGLLANETHRGDASEFAHEAVEHADALLDALEAKP